MFQTTNQLFYETLNSLCCWCLNYGDPFYPTQLTEEKCPEGERTSWVPRQFAAAADVLAHSRPTLLEVTHEPSTKFAFLSKTAVIL